jgi:dTDP-4-dehydrorhamnose 3,5-epimerase-like enzyme
MVGAGAVVTHDAPAYTIVAGNPARIIGYAGTESSAALETGGYPPPGEPGSQSTAVKGVTIHRLPVVDDLRGQLSFGEIMVHVPFEVKRYFLVYEVSSEHIRGEHAHKKLRQFMICVHGSCHVVADDGERRQEFVLDNPGVAVYLPPMVWGVQYKYSSDAALLVFASEPYDPDDYIRDYGEFLSLRAAHGDAG